MEEKKTYKNKVVFLRKSKKGNHLYCFNNDNALGNNVESLIMNISEVKDLIAEEETSIKVSVKEIEKDKGQAVLPSKQEKKKNGVKAKN